MSIKPIMRGIETESPRSNPLIKKLAETESGLSDFFISALLLYEVHFCISFGISDTTYSMYITGALVGKSAFIE